ncbi:MAG: molybdopterin-dependent oxidoreductase, partial [bacterium]|nr:molybdopterin-dependent oxidoreductase [bacterium]
IAVAAAEELRLPLDSVRVVMCDTDLVPNDGLTVGSRTTPSTIPEVRQAAAAAREILINAASGKWKADRASLKVRDGVVVDPNSNRRFTYAELARLDEPAEALKGAVPPDVKLTRPEDWKLMGTPVPKIGGRAVVTGEMRYAADFQRPGMLYGKVLRPPSYGATLKAVDLAPARKMKGVVAVHDGNFVGCAAPTSFLAAKAVEAVGLTAKWQETEQPSSDEIFAYLKNHPKESNTWMGRPFQEEQGSVEEGLASAKQVLQASYQVSYIQHAPMEPRSAIAEWSDGRLTV